MIANKSSCKTASGSWKECAAVWSVANAGGAAAPEPEPEPEPSPSEGQVASPDFSFQGAVTEDGEACILPTTVSPRRELRGERRG